MAGTKVKGFRSRSSHKISANCSGVMSVSVGKECKNEKISESLVYRYYVVYSMMLIQLKIDISQM